MTLQVSQVSQLPPAVPHIQANVTPLSVILKRQSQHTYKQLKEFIKTLHNTSQSDNFKKKHFLDLIVQVRENFIRLYVLCKWARNSKSIEKLIDLFVWLREQNQSITNALMAIGAIKQQLVSAKLPNPDLTTALEVLIKGRPQLPTYNFIQPKPLNSQLILKTLRNLNVELSTRMALEEDLPLEFYQYTIKDGRVTFNVPNSFQCSISIADDSPDSKFFLVDFKLGFQSNNNELIPNLTSLPNLTFRHLEKYANLELSKGSLRSLFQLLHNYSTTCKLYLLHRHLIQLRMGIWKGHITHTYNAEKCFVIVTYWLKRRSIKSTIEIGKFKNSNNELGFRWIKEGQLFKDHDFKLSDDESGKINIELLIRNIIKKHIEINIKLIKNELMDKAENMDKICTIGNNSQLILDVSHTKTVVYSIDSLSGDGFFQNPNPLMNLIANQINMDPILTPLGLLNLRLQAQLTEISSMLKAAGWINVDSIKLNSHEQNKLGMNYDLLKQKNLSSQLFNLMFYRRKDWPSGWFLTVGVPGFSSNVQWWCSRIKSSSGQWSVSWSEPVKLIAKENRYDYSSLLTLVKITTSKLLSNLIVKELKDQGCDLKIVDTTDNENLVKQFVEKSLDGDLNLNNEERENNTLIIINNKSLYNIPSARESLVLSVSSKGDSLDISLFGKLQQELRLPGISFTDEQNNSIELKPESSVFKIHSVVNLKEKLKQHNNTTPSNTNGNNNIYSSVMTLANGSNGNEVSLMESPLMVLKRLSSLLSLLQLVSNDSSLKMSHISLSQISFQYGDRPNESITLKVLNEQQNTRTSSILIELPPTNPHQVCIKHLNSLIMNDLTFKRIKELIKYLKITLPFYKLYLKLEKETNDAFYDFNDSNNQLNFQLKDMKLIPEVGFDLSMYNFELLKIVYYKTTENKKIEKKSKTEIVKVKLKIELRHKGNKLSLTNSVFLISLEPPISESSGEDKLKFQEIRQSLAPVFRGDSLISVPSPAKVQYLRNALVCDSSCVETVVEQLHSRLKTLMR